MPKMFALKCASVVTTNRVPPDNICITWLELHVDVFFKIYDNPVILKKRDRCLLT